MKKRLIGLALVFVMLFGLTACGSEETLIPVERVSMLLAATQLQDRFAGIVVSEDVVKVDRDMEKAVKEVYVTEGQDVEEGDKLFSYDSEELTLSRDKEKLELEKLNNQLTNTKNQIKAWNTELTKTKDESAKLEISLQIQQYQITQIEQEHEITVKKKEIERIEEMLKNVDVFSPATGRIKSIADANSYSDGAYITIQKAGAYRVKGTLNEMSMAAGIMEGVSVRILSRLDSSLVWTGYVSMVDYENADQNQGNNLDSWGNDSGMSASTGYPFYVELDSTEGLLLGQHVYIEVDNAEAVRAGIWLPAKYITELTSDSLTGKVLVANGEDKLEQISVDLGEFDESIGCYQVVSGLSGSDFIADPTLDGCQAGAGVEYRDEGDFNPETAPYSPDSGAGEGEDFAGGEDSYGDTEESVSFGDGEFFGDADAGSAEGEG